MPNATVLATGRLWPGLSLYDQPVVATGDGLRHRAASGAGAWPHMAVRAVHPTAAPRYAEMNPLAMIFRGRMRGGRGAFLVKRVSGLAFMKRCQAARLAPRGRGAGMLRRCGDSGTRVHVYSTRASLWQFADAV